jgi:phage tail-like protein
MSEISSYVNYLPPVLWFRDQDPDQLLGRTLRVFEKLLTGIPINARVVRASASLANASGNRIVLNNSADAARFRSGDIITIEGTTERVQISHIIGAEIFLVAALVGTYAGGVVRIANLEPGQNRFRLDNGTNLGPGIVINIIQAGTSEIATVSRLQDEFITLRTGLVQSYPMGDTAVPVRIQDGQPLMHGGHHHGSIDDTIENLYQLFSPWRTPPDFLPWLASWVALTLRKDWSEYQRRKLISEMVVIYQQRGLKRGLQTYLDIYVATEARPRIAIDDGEAIFRARFADDGTARLFSVAHSQSITFPSGPISVLLHPTGLAIDNSNNYIIADEGDVALTPLRPPALWQISSTGKVDYAPGPPLPSPRPIHSGSPLEKPTGVTVDSLDRYSIVDIGTITSGVSLDSAIYRFTPPTYTLSTVIDQASIPSLPAVHPVDMILDGSENFVVLDRGFHPLGDPPSGPSAPKIVAVSEGPLAVAPPHPLSTVVEPTAMVMDSMGRFIIADAKDQFSANPVDLVRVDPGAGWSETSLLLGALPADPNPLVFPTGLAFESPEVLLVCDTGLRWGYDPMDPQGSDPTYRYLAEPAAIYRVDLSQAPPTITRITPDQQLVNPTKMTFDRQGKLIISDRGDSLRSAPQRSWRAGSNEFGVIVHFSRQRPTGFAERNQIRGGIFRVIEQEKPGHSTWWMDF